MPEKALTICKYPGCNQLTRDTYCDKHRYVKQEEKKNENKYYDNYRRNKQSEIFYKSDEWARLREYILSKYNYLDLYAYYTQGKVRKANTVHHIKEINKNWNHRLDENNLFPTSDSNHNIIHKLYKKNKEKTQKLLFELLEKYKNDFGN